MCGQSWVYNRYATTHIINPLFPGFSRYASVNKEIIISADIIKEIHWIARMTES